MSEVGSVFVVFLMLFGLSVEGRLLGSPSKANTLAKHSALVTSVLHSQAPVLAKPTSKVMAKPTVVAVRTNHSAKTQKHHAKKKNVTDMEQVASFKIGLEAIKNLQSDFTAGQDASGDAQGIKQMAEGSMTTELHKKDSKFWVTIQQMLKETTGAMSKMTNATVSGRKSILHDLESSINASADTLKDVTEKVGKTQEKQSDEYLVGLLNQHRNEWSMEKQLNVTKQFSSSSPTAQELLRHHNMKEPLATQLARLMDSARSASNSKANKTAKLFLQLEEVIHVIQA